MILISISVYITPCHSVFAVTWDRNGPNWQAWQTELHLALRNHFSWPFSSWFCGVLSWRNSWRITRCLANLSDSVMYSAMQSSKRSNDNAFSATFWTNGSYFFDRSVLPGQSPLWRYHCTGEFRYHCLRLHVDVLRSLRSALLCLPGT